MMKRLIQYHMWTTCLILSAYVASFSVMGYSAESSVQHATPVAGDIVVYAGAFNNSYTKALKKYNITEHAGIFCEIDGDEYVIEVANGSGDGDNVSAIRKRSYQKFKAHAEKIGQPVTIHAVDTEKTSDEIIADALYYLENPSEFFDADHPHYDPLRWNYQHFAMLCRTGEASSWQGDVILKGASFLGQHVLSDENTQRAQNAYSTLVKHQGHLQTAANYLRRAWRWYNCSDSTEVAEAKSY